MMGSDRSNLRAPSSVFRAPLLGRCMAAGARSCGGAGGSQWRTIHTSSAVIAVDSVMIDIYRNVGWSHALQCVLGGAS